MVINVKASKLRGPVLILPDLRVTILKISNERERRGGWREIASTTFVEIPYKFLRAIHISK